MGVRSSISAAPNWLKISRNSCSLWALFDAIRIEFALDDIGKGKYTERRGHPKAKTHCTTAHASKRLTSRLADWLTEELERPVSKAKARKLIIAGAVYVNGRRVMIPSQGLLPGAAIEAHVDVAKLFDDSTSRDRALRADARSYSV